MIVIDEDEDIIDDCFLLQKKSQKKKPHVFNEEDINDGESEEKIKSKTTNLEGLLSKINGKSNF